MDKERVTRDYKVFSFDVFDTCISRMYERPTDLFFEVGSIVAPAEFDADRKHAFSLDFAKRRVLAEREANRRHGKGRSCKFSEIYDLIELPADCLMAKNDIAAIELKLEVQSSFPISSTRALISNRRAAGGKIVFVSDMYLPTDFIANLLLGHQLAQPGDAIYVSSENTLTKRSGELFKYVLAKENIPPSELLHHGDDLSADIRSARRLGIDSVHVQSALIAADERIAPESFGSSDVSRMNGLSRYVRLTHFADVDRAQLRSLNLIAQFLLQFTLWVFLEARRLGVRTLFFLAKDSEITFKIAKLINSDFPEISVKYLYSSRRAWLKPSISLEDGNWKALALPDGPRSSLKDALERIDVSPQTMEKFEQYCGLKGLEFSAKESNARCSVLLDEVLRSDSCRDALLSEIEDSRGMCLDYLAQEGLRGESTWAVVDTGWQLNCQAALKRMLASTSSEHSCLGFYLGLSGNHLSEQVAGRALSLTRPGSIFARRRVAVEHLFFAAKHASTVGYERRPGIVLPRLSADGRTDGHLRYVDSLHDYVTKFAEAFVLNGISHTQFVRSRESVVGKMENLLLVPPAEFLRRVAEIRVSSDARHSVETDNHIVRPLRTRDLVRIANAYRRGRQRELNFYWLEASVASSNVLIRMVFRFARLFRFGHGRHHEVLTKDGNI